MFDLSIFIPTHYAGPRHYSVIMAACELARTNRNIEVVVSDNSELPEKFAFLSTFASENFRVIKGPELKNHLFALEQTTGRYVMAVGDDDTLLPAAFPGLIAALNADNSFIGTMGQFGRELGTGYDFHQLPGVDDVAFGTRVTGVANTIGLGNPIFHAIVDRNVLLASYKLWHAFPNPMSHHDQLMSLFVACSGRLKLAAQPYFIYNIANHLRDQTVNTEIRYAKFFGHPVSLWILSRLMLAVEGAFLIQSPDFPVAADQRNIAASAWFRGWHGAWLHSLNDNYYVGPEFTSCPDAIHVRALAEKYLKTTQFEPKTMLEEIAGLYEVISGSGARYLDFWTRMASDGVAAATASEINLDGCAAA
ncbi:glycosyltransferase [Burkholderia sp. F1]|uniref:glycosyltransferase n=1 Tax=Burkholderia sp. F1 TaxID=3366817 RepID=UPI003D75FF44